MKKLEKSSSSHKLEIKAETVYSARSQVDTTIKSVDMPITMAYVDWPKFCMEMKRLVDKYGV